MLYGGWEFLDEVGDEARMARVNKVKHHLKEFETVVINGGMWMGMRFEPHLGEENVEVLVVSHGAFLSKLLGYPSKFSSSQTNLEKRK